MNTHSESIYGWGNSNLPIHAWGAVTQSVYRLFLHVFEPSDSGEIIVGGFKNNPVVAYIQDGFEKHLEWKLIDISSIELDLTDQTASSELPLVVVMES